MSNDGESPQRWARNTDSEDPDRRIREWWSDDDYVTIINLGGRFEVTWNGIPAERFPSLCEAAEYAITKFGIIPVHSAWKHTVTDDRYIVKHQHPESLPETHDWYPTDFSEPWIYCSTPDYETRDDVWLAKRIFPSQLKLIDWNL